MATKSLATGVNTSDATLRSILTVFQNNAITKLFNVGGLAIKAGASALAKTVNTVRFLIQGSLASKAAADMAALAGTVVNATFNVYCFYVNASGTLTTVMGTAGASLAAVVFPTFDPTSVAMLGFVIINPTGTGNFVGGTTALDDATVVPNAVYVDTTNADFANSQLL